jgi:elongator complex protein 2
MEQVQIFSEFICVGGNRHPSAADWISINQQGANRDALNGQSIPNSREVKNTLLAYAAYNNIALWDPHDISNRGVYALLSGHVDTVNAVAFLPTSDPRRLLLLTGGADKEITLWQGTIGTEPYLFECKEVLKHHTGSVNCIATLPSHNLFVSGAADASIRIWSVQYGEQHASQVDFKSANLIQTIMTKPSYIPLTLALQALDHRTVILAVAGTKNTIQIYIGVEQGCEYDFTFVTSLVGHEGWIRSLAFAQETEDSDSDILLASASQDKYIRLWRIHKGEHLPTASRASRDPALGSVGRTLSNKPHWFSPRESETYSITFEALLFGHEDWIYSARWHRRHGPSEKSKIQLLSASADNSLAIWEQDEESGIWLPTTRLGEISAQKGATTATGSTGGFWVGLWSPNGDTVVSLGRTGSWRLWKQELDGDQESSAVLWKQGIGISGHVKEVKDLCWATDGSYLLSTGLDQTTRLFAKWKKGGVGQKIQKDDKLHGSWHEFSRPQIHGYDLNCIASINPIRFISGADEKLLRVFDEPAAVATLLSNLCDIQTSTPSSSLPDAANIPVLGLSNKAIKMVTDEDADTETSTNDLVDLNDGSAADSASVVPKSILVELERQPPNEDHLARHLLWPEREKLYGHGYEISAVAVSYSGGLVATACKASSIEHAVIRLFETNEWREIKPPLQAHSLTVTALAFSWDDKYLLSAGRDRMWTIFEQDNEIPTLYSKRWSDPKGHTRMILSASWASSGEKKVFATAGRDKIVKLWEYGAENDVWMNKVSVGPGSCPVTAVAFYNDVVSFPGGDKKEYFLFAYGLEDGRVGIARVDEHLTQVEATFVDGRLVPSGTVNGLAWNKKGSHILENMALAIAGADCSVRILDIRVL